MDIRLTSSGDLYLSKNGDIELTDSIAQKINVRLRWVLGEWKWNKDAGLPYFEELFVKNPDIEGFKRAVREMLLEIDEVTSISSLEISISIKDRNALINYIIQARTETISGEVEYG